MTALVTTGGSVVERYVYQPFGAVTVYDATWTVRSGGTFYAEVYMFQGLRNESLTGTYDGRNRVYSVSLGRWGQVDPIRAGTNFYVFVGNNSTNMTDPSGLQAEPKTFPNMTPADKDPQQKEKDKLKDAGKLGKLIFEVKDRKTLTDLFVSGVLEKDVLYKYIVKKDGTIVVINTSRDGEKHLTHIMGTEPCGEEVQAAGHFKFTGRDKVSIDIISTHYTKSKKEALSDDDKKVAIAQAKAAWKKLYKELDVTDVKDAK